VLNEHRKREKRKLLGEGRARGRKRGIFLARRKRRTSRTEWRQERPSPCEGRGKEILKARGCLEVGKLQKGKERRNSATLRGEKAQGLINRHKLRKTQLRVKEKKKRL